MGFNGYRHNPVDHARDVHCPVLLMHGAKDTRVTHEQARSIFDNLAGEKQFHILEGVGHESYFGSRPDEWVTTVAPFLAAHASPP
jgi:alpha-beta hydrolase superfamily lysophospholipase